MKTKLANIFLIFGLILYVLAGIATMIKMNYSIIILLAATIFLAFGFFVNVKLRWIKLFKKRVRNR